MNNFRRTVIGCVCSLVAGLSSASEINVAIEATFPPFEFKDTASGEYVGFDLDLIKAVMDRTGSTIKITPMGFEAIIPAILSNIVDVGISGFTITEQRRKRVAFSDPYYDSSLTILVPKEDTNTKTFNDLKNKVVCVQIGTSGSLRAKSIQGATVKNFNSQADAILEMSAKGCSAVIGDRPVTDYFLVKSKSNKFKHIVLNEDVEQYGIVVSKRNKELLDKINGGLKAIKDDGTYDKIYTKWFGSK